MRPYGELKPDEIPKADPKRMVVGKEPDRRFIELLKGAELEEKEDIEKFHEILSDIHIDGSGSHPLNDDHIMQFYQKVDKSKNFIHSVTARLIVCHTSRIPMKVMLKALNKSWDKFLIHNKDLKSYYLQCDQYKIGSQHLLITFMKERLTGLKGIISEIDDHVKDVVIVDDMIYSGCFISGEVETLVYKLKRKEKINIHIVIPFVTQEGLNLLYSVKKMYDILEIFVYPIYVVNGIKEIIEMHKEELSTMYTMDDLHKLTFDKREYPIIRSDEKKDIVFTNRKCVEQDMKNLVEEISPSNMPGCSLEDIKNEILENILFFACEWGHPLQVFMEKAMKHGARWPGCVWPNTDRILATLMTDGDVGTFAWAIEHGCPITKRDIKQAKAHKRPIFIKILQIYEKD